ncbi:hypothetical protein ACTXK0_09505 [Corynebacterium variabile]|uniref:hypothetical protein n=1 Tax=Corynebacterium variabile TaxID=1727 RepID=UPI003FD41FF1
MIRADLRRQIEEGPSQWREVPQQITPITPDYPEVPVTFPAGTMAHAVQRILAETVEMVYEFEQRFRDKRGEPDEIMLDHARHEAEFIMQLWYEARDCLPARWTTSTVLAGRVPVSQHAAAVHASWREGGYRSLSHVATLAVALSEVADKIAADEDHMRLVEGWVLTVRAVSHAVFPVAGEVWVPPSEAAEIVGRSKRTIQRWKEKRRISTFNEWVLLSDVKKLAA